MSTKSDGGSAFPHDGIHLPGYPSAQLKPSVGMTLRDYFAAGAILALSERCQGLGPEYLADRAYEIADAMILRRDKS